jgi:hypothetical protein
MAAETTIAVLRAWAPAKRSATLLLTLIGFPVACSMLTGSLRRVWQTASSNEVQHAFGQYCDAVLDRERQLRESYGNCLNQLKRKEIRWFYGTDHLPTQESIGPTGTTKLIENKMLDRRFAVAPMMDGVGSFLRSNSWIGVVCKSCARRFYFSFAFVLTKLPPAVAECSRSCIAGQGLHRGGRDERGVL